MCVKTLIKNKEKDKEMEKVKIKSCVKSETAKGTTYYKIEAEDGRVE